MSADTRRRFAAHKRHKCDTYRDPGYLSLGKEIVNQALKDYEALVQAGAIVDGRAITPYPVEREKGGRIIPHRFLNTYNSEREINLLIGFVKSNRLRTLVKEFGMEAAPCHC